MLFLIVAEELRQTKDEMGAEAYGIGHDMPIFFNSSMGHGAFFGFLFFVCGTVDSHDMRSQLTIILQTGLGMVSRAPKLMFLYRSHENLLLN